MPTNSGGKNLKILSFSLKISAPKTSFIQDRIMTNYGHPWLSDINNHIKNISKGMDYPKNLWQVLLSTFLEQALLYCLQLYTCFID